ncbi:MAG: M48 family metallopeptidase [Clostridia bacterium]|nr:M48 family metallopeptidase [Clostridia bacterium]
MVINVDGIEVKLIRKNVRRITLKVDPDGSVSISAPKSAKIEYVQSFVLSKTEWIRSVLAKKSDGPFFINRCNNGDKITILGNTYTIKLVIDGGKKVELSGDSVLVHLSEKNVERREKILLDWMKFSLEREVVGSLKKWNTITGLDCSDVVFKDMKSRWGSCNVVTKKIAFSLRLLSQKSECIDYVVLHELTHTVHRNHDRNFYGYIERFMPDYKRISKSLVMPVKNQ